ncbi:uncharacterized protein LOC108928875 [Scleropages formosus]|uniref:uncharacterized protein LOC108928875 n=1 Tax=Scleropages formosus TaxID=113540 RepID=UPI0010FA99C2|nr:uncharacterized protein LOC108928875 [Scleropages formosus]
MTLKYSLYFLSLIYVATGIGVAQEEENEEFEIRKDLLPVDQPVITVSQNQSGSLVVQLKGDMKLKKEYADHHKYRIFYKKDNGEFKLYDDVLTKNTHVVMKNLQAGVKYCFQMRYIVYHKSIKDVNDSTVECAVITEKQESRMNRILWVLTITGVLGVLLVACCMWVVLKNYSKVKRALRPPLDVPDHIREFLSEEELPKDWLKSNSGPDSENTCDSISVMTSDNSNCTSGSSSPRTHFYLGRTTTC